MRILSIILGAVAIITTALPITRHPGWWVRIWDFPRIQIAVLGTIAIVVFVFSGSVSSPLEIVFIVFVASSVGFQAYMIYPYTRLVSPQTQRTQDPDPDNTISVLFANVLMDNRNVTALKDIVRKADADVILLVETDDWWLESIREEFSDHPFTVLHPLDNTYGMLLFSRLELIDPEVQFLVNECVPSIHCRVRLRSGQELEMRCIHPPPPIYGEAVSAEPRDAELIIVGKQNRGNDAPFIVFGDLNDVAWSRTNYMFQDISGLLDPRIGRGFYSTFHAKIPFLKMPLDHLFHSNHFRLVEFRRLGYFGSDHFPVFVKLCLEADAPYVQEEPSPTNGELAEAKEKLKYLDHADPGDINTRE